MNTRHLYCPNLIVRGASLLFVMNIGTIAIAQDPPPFKDTPEVNSPDQPITTPTPTTQPPESSDDKPPFPDTGNPDIEEKSPNEEAPFTEPTPPPQIRTNNSTSPYPGFPSRLSTVELEVIEVKRLAEEELNRLKLRGQYATTLVSSRLSQTRQANIGILRESVAISKNLVVGRRLSLGAFTQIQRECINEELALAQSSSMRTSILNKAIDACRFIEEKVQAMAGPNSVMAAPLFNPSDLELVTVQREHWEQLLTQGSSSTTTWSSQPTSSVIVTSPSNTIYCRPTRRRR